MPRTQTAALALSPARELLQQALKAMQRARTIESKAAMVVEQATAAVEEASATMASFEGLDDDVVKARLAALKGEPGRNPEDIREARRKRIMAKEDLEAATATLQVAKHELEEARGNVARSQRMTASHATSILSEFADTVIASWKAANEEAGRMRAILEGLTPVIGEIDRLLPEQRTNVIQNSVTAAGLPFGDATDWLHVQNKLQAVLAWRFESAPGMGREKARAFWRHFADAVLADPAAEAAPLPSGEELFN